MQGAPPLASPGLNRRGAGSIGGRRPHAAKPARRWLFLPRQCFLPPSPRPPSRWEGGDFWFSYARGSAPCIPGAEPAQHWLNRGAGAPGTPAAKPARHWLFSAMSVLFYPHPPCPLPGGKGETKVILCKGLRPLASPGLNPRGAGLPEGSAPAPLWLSPRGTDIPSGRNHLNITESTLVNAYL